MHVQRERGKVRWRWREMIREIVGRPAPQSEFSALLNDDRNLGLVVLPRGHVLDLAHRQ